jgi:hypothetical protein
MPPTESPDQCRQRYAELVQTRDRERLVGCAAGGDPYTRLLAILRQRRRAR